MNFWKLGDQLEHEVLSRYAVWVWEVVDSLVLSKVPVKRFFNWAGLPAEDPITGMITLLETLSKQKTLCSSRIMIH